MKNMVRVLTCSTLSILLASCAEYTKPQQGRPAVNQINATLANGIDKNQQLATAKAEPLPSSINQALLPNVAITNTDVEAEARFNISVKDTPAKDFFIGLVKGTAYNIIVDPKVTGMISLDLKNVTVSEVLQAVHDLYGYNFQSTPYGYQITPAGLETQVFDVNYLDVIRSGQSSTSISSGQISQTTNNNSPASSGSSGSSGSSTSTSVSNSSNVNTQTTNNFWKELQDTLVTLLSKEDGRKVIINQSSGTVIVTASPEELKQIGDYLDSLQSIISREVIIDAKILEITLNNAFQAGVDWSVLGVSQNFSPKNISGNVVGPTTGNQALDNGLQPFSSIFSLDVHGKNFSTIIHLLSGQGNVQVLSSPHIATLNNQKAVIKVGQDEFFITNVSSSDTTPTAGGTQTTQNITLTPFFSGIALDVTPEISGDNNVILHIHPIVSNVIDQVKDFKINGNQNQLPLALSTTRESDNIVYAQDDQMVVIGGLMGDSTSETVAETPFLAKLPLIGNLFRRTNQQATKSEIIILLRPIIVNSQTLIDKLQKDRAQFENLTEGFHAGAYPETFGNTGDFPEKEDK